MLDAFRFVAPRSAAGIRGEGGTLRRFATRVALFANAGDLPPRVVATLLALVMMSVGCHSARGPLGAAQPARSDAPPNVLTDAERAAGWRLLFDGRTLAGWRGVGAPEVPAGHWTVKDGAIEKVATANVPLLADGRRAPGGDLMTVDTYRDFELSWDWKITPVGNSGVKYNVSEELSTAAPQGSHSAIGFEYQMIDDDRHSDGKLPTHRTGALYDLITPNANKRVNPIGEWNHSVIVFVGDHGEHWLNGMKVVEYDLGSATLRAALAASKFRSMPWFAERRAGHIVLQDHGDEIYVRSIKIRERR